MRTGVRHEVTGTSQKAKVFFLWLCAMLFALTVPAEAQQPEKIAKIGILENRSDPPRSVSYSGESCARSAKSKARTSLCYGSVGREAE